MVNCPICGSEAVKWRDEGGAFMSGDYHVTTRKKLYCCHYHCGNHIFIFDDAQKPYTLPDNGVLVRISELPRKC